MSDLILGAYTVWFSNGRIKEPKEKYSLGL